MSRRSLALFVSGLALGALFVSPVGAHVTDQLDHLWNGNGHVKDKVTNLGDNRWARKAHNHNKTYPRYGIRNALPPGKSLTGTVVGRVQTGGQFVLDDMSFAHRLTFDPIVEIRETTPASPSTNCPGTFLNPRSRPGYLCLYTGFTAGFPSESWGGVWDPLDGTSCGCRRGAVAYANSASAGAEIAGSWSVTAPRASSPTASVRNAAPRAGTGARG
jgi:hypothetical protein